MLANESNIAEVEMAKKEAVALLKGKQERAEEQMEEETVSISSTPSSSQEEGTVGDYICLLYCGWLTCPVETK